ncbi:MAG TPA: hypothetical protein VIH90_01080 [Candidatus Saccharimonadales bacterium]
MDKPKDSKLLFIKFARLLTVLVYLFFIIATVFLVIGFFLLLFGANPNTPFVKFVYHFAALFLQPFRGIFPGHQISDRSYFSGAAFFAIIMYGIGALALNSLITFVTMKQTQHQQELLKIQREQEWNEQEAAQLKKPATTTSQSADTNNIRRNPPRPKIS